MRDQQHSFSAALTRSKQEGGCVSEAPSSAGSLLIPGPFRNRSFTSVNSTARGSGLLSDQTRIFTF